MCNIRRQILYYYLNSVIIYIWKRVKCLASILWDIYVGKLQQSQRVFQVLKAFSEAEKTKLGPYSEAYKDVYDKMTPRIQKQLDETKAHVNKYKEHYSLDKYEST